VAFDPGDIVKVPFPYTYRSVREWRPALVVAAGRIAEDHGLLWVLMITSAVNRGWPGDVAIPEDPSNGLPAPSLVRCAKIVTIDMKEATRIGRLQKTALEEVERRLKVQLAG
jgi:mRNA interferase MazF